MSDENEYQRRMEELTKENERKRFVRLQRQYLTTPDFAHMSLRDELKTRLDLDELNQLKQKYNIQSVSGPNPNTSNSFGSQYGDATAEKIEEYIKDYQYPQGQVRTGLMAPIYDMFRNYNSMKDKQLVTGDLFFIARPTMKPHQEELTVQRLLI